MQKQDIIYNGITSVLCEVKSYIHGNETTTKLSKLLSNKKQTLSLNYSLFVSRKNVFYFSPLLSIILYLIVFFLHPITIDTTYLVKQDVKITCLLHKMLEIKRMTHTRVYYMKVFQTHVYGLLLIR